MSIEDPQVVNGLQTSRQIFDHFRNAQATTETRAVLVKVLPVKEPVHRDAIIQATNSQNAMSSGSLRAIDYVHNQIEDLFKTFGLFYDRKKGFHRDQGAPIAAIVSVTELVQALVSILQARPDSARARPGDYINKDPEYRKIFGRDKVPLGAYYKCVSIVRAIDEFLRTSGVDKGEQRNQKYYLAYVLVAELTKRVHPSPEEVLGIESHLVNDVTIKQASDVVSKHYIDLILGEPPDAVAKGPEFLRLLKAELSAKYVDVASPRTRKRKPKDVLTEGGLR